MNDLNIDFINIENIRWYDNTATYFHGDMVRYNNSIYKCKERSIYNLPTNLDYWDIYCEL